MGQREVLIGLGANQQRPQAAIHEAVRRLSACADQTGGALLKSSGLIQTKAVAHDPQDDYCNAAIRMQTPLEPLELLKQLQAIEQEMGRERKQHWGSRVIDLDVLLYEEKILFDPQLHVPHPWLSVRRFALAPCVEIAGAWQHPLLHRSLAQLLADHQRTQIVVATVQELTDGHQHSVVAELCRSAKRHLRRAKLDSSRWVWRLDESPRKDLEGQAPQAPCETRVIARMKSDWSDWSEVAAMVVIGELADLYQQTECLRRLREIGKPFVASSGEPAALAETLQFVDAAMRS